MPELRPLTGLFGKVPAHGDFVRRGLPTSFVGPWDAWLQDGVARAREAAGARWPDVWDRAPPWRFALPAGACGPDAVAGVMLPSEDQVGRRFPITLAALLAPGAAPPPAAWFDAVEAAALAGRAGRADADALAAAIPLPGADVAAPSDTFLPGLDLAPDPPPAPHDAMPAPPAPIAPDPDPPGMDGPTAFPALPGLDEETMQVPIDLDPFTPADVIPDRGDDILGVFAGDTTVPIEPAASADADPLPGIAWSAAAPPSSPGDEAPPAGAPAADDDVLSFFAAGPAATMPAGPAAEPAPDATLALLIGAGAAASPRPSDDPGSAHDMTCARAGDPWAMAAAPEPPDQAAIVAPPADPPPAPDGGGWWTRGGAHVPAMVWALAALPAPADFAYLLEAEA